MDSVNRSAVTPNKSRLARTFAKVLHIRAATGGTKVDKVQKTKSCPESKLFENEEDLGNRVAVDAFISKVFATVSSVKAAYAQLQFSQSPYDAPGIQSADQIVVSELKNLSEFKQSYLKKHIDDPSPETTRLLAEIQEQRSLVKLYEITGKKLDRQSKLKDSEIIFFKEKLAEANRENKSTERRLNSSGPISQHQEDVHFLSLSPSNFLSVLKQTTRSIRSLVRFMIGEMEYANWDLDAAASSIHPNVVYWDPTHKCYALESFVCREMFDGFNDPNFSVVDLPSNKNFLDIFMELKYLKAKEYIAWKPTSTFARFCWSKYLRLVHPKMELSLFENLNQRNLVAAGKFPETSFFSSFAAVAKWVWLLHCLAFSLEASIFEVAKGSRFSEVYMESINEEAFLSPESPRKVAFTVVPGFKVAKTVIQCQVYLS